jgi:hypothetical protein
MAHISFWAMPMMIIQWEKKYHTENPKVLLDASKEVGLEVDPEKTKYVLVLRFQKAGQRQSVKIANRSCDDV